MTLIHWSSKETNKTTLRVLYFVLVCETNLFLSWRSFSFCSRVEGLKSFRSLLFSMSIIVNLVFKYTSSLAIPIYLF